MSERSPDQLKTEAMTLFQQGAYDDALVQFETAARRYANQEQEAEQAEMLNNIGVIQRLKGNVDASLAALSQAETIFARVGDRNRQAQTLGNMGDLYADNKNRQEAARCYSDAAQLFAEDGDRAKQSQVLRALSLMRLRQGQWTAAMMRMEESLNVRPRLGPFQWLFRGMLRFALSLFGAR